MNKSFDESFLTRTVFLFGAVGHGPYGFMTFSKDGRITTYKHPNEAFFEISNDQLLILNEQRQITSTLRPSNSESGRFTSSGKIPHFLEPVFCLSPSSSKASELPPLVVNTVPKSGTYLIAEALRISGYTQIEVHLSSEFLHDNRGIDDANIHWSPNDRAVPVPARAIANILMDGEFVVGHIDNENQLHDIQESNCKLINVVRNPYDQILSMLKFKIQKVAPKPSDKIWHSMNGIDQLKAFILSHPVEYWLNFSRMLSENFSALRYEDIISGKADNSGLPLELEEMLSRGLQKANGRATSTLLARTPTDWFEMFKDESVTEYLRTLGFEEYTERFWPSSTDG